MIAQFIQFLPCFVSLAFLFICTGARRKYHNGYFVMACICCTVYFFVDAAYVTFGTNMRTLLKIDPLGHLSLHALIPAYVIYLFSEWKHRSPKLFVYLAYLPSVILGVTTFVLTFSAGIDRLADFFIEIGNNGYKLPSGAERDLVAYFIISTKVSIYLVMLEMLLCLGFIVSAYISKKKEGTFDPRFRGLVSHFLLIMIISTVRMVLSRAYLTQHQAISCVLSALTAGAIVGIGYWHVTQKGRSLLQAEEGETEGQPIAEEQEKEEESLSASATNALKKQLVAYIKDEQAFLDPGITLDQVAEHLRTNRTYISMIMNKEFGKSFREAINHCRIDYAKQYILEHRDAKLEEVADASGFTSGSQFSRKFKEVEGVTPINWIRRQI